MGPPLSAAVMRQMLSEALERYCDHEERGDDMLDAGAELALRVRDIAAGPVCGMPRGEYLQDMGTIGHDDLGEFIDDVEPQPGDYRD